MEFRCRTWQLCATRGPEQLDDPPAAAAAAPRITFTWYCVGVSAATIGLAIPKLVASLQDGSIELSALDFIVGVVIGLLYDLSSI